jgi:hypothetical protein
MPRLRLTIDEMQKLLLDDIRSRPRCAGVAAVLVKLDRKALANNWTIGPIAYGTADPDVVDKAAANTQARISPHYDLTDG